MHRSRNARQTRSEETKKSRVSGEIFIAPQAQHASMGIETRRSVSRLDPNMRFNGDSLYKYFAPTALAFLILLAGYFQSAFAQRRPAATAIPSPRSVLGFDPGD